MTTTLPDHTAITKPKAGYRSLSPSVRLDETIASVDANPVPDPAAGRNVDQHRAFHNDASAVASGA